MERKIPRRPRSLGNVMCSCGKQDAGGEGQKAAVAGRGRVLRLQILAKGPGLGCRISPHDTFLSLISNDHDYQCLNATFLVDTRSISEYVGIYRGMSKSIVQRGKEGVREALARSVASGQRSSFLLLTGRRADRQQGGGRGEDEEERRGEGGRAHSIEPRGHAQLNCTLRAKEI